MTTVLAGGDSFIWGSELADSPHGGLDGYSRSTFPALLATEYTCVAYPGLGNAEITRRIKEACRHAVYDLVIVCWTWPTRDDHLTGDRQIVELQQYLESYNIPYLFTCVDNCLIDLLDPKTNWDHWYLFPAGTEPGDTSTPRGFYQWAVENKYKVGPDGHPLEAAHADAAVMIKDKFDEVVKKYYQLD